MNILIRMIGIIALCASVYSFQMKTHKKIMTLQIIANFSFALQMFLLGINGEPTSFTGAILNFLAFLRSIVFYNKNDHKWAKSQIWIWGFIVAFIVAGIYTYSAPISLIAIVGMVLSTFSFSSTKPFVVRSTILISSPMWLVYDFLIGSYEGTLNECLVILSTIIGIFRHDLKRKTKTQD